MVAWMADTGRGYKAAAAHFGLPVNRVKQWKRRETHPEPPRPKKRLSDKAETLDPVDVEDVTGGESVVAKSASDKLLSRGRGGGPTASSPSSPRARAVPPDRAPRASVTEAIGPELRGYLRKGAVRLARFVAGEDKFIDPDTGKEVLPDMQSVAHAARALDILLARTPDLMTFDAATTPPASTEDRAARAASLAAAMGVQPALPLTVVGGRDVADSP